jgi:hypothetical protein
LLITVNNIQKNKDKLLVSFSSEFGNADAFWDGVYPCEGEPYNVELDIEDTFTWGINIFKSNQTFSSIKYNKLSNIEIVGCLESLDEDGFAVMRLKNYIVTFFTDQLPDIQGSYVLIIVKKMTLFPYNL